MTARDMVDETSGQFVKTTTASSAAIVGIEPGTRRVLAIPGAAASAAAANITSSGTSGYRYRPNT